MSEVAGVPAIELVAIDKSFGSVHAVRGVSLAIDKGAITGIVGENGAGKSTLMSILYGLYRADSGEIRVDGQAVQMESPRDAIAHGVGMVHQHFMLIDTFTVLENLVLGAEGGPMLASGMAKQGKSLTEIRAAIDQGERERGDHGLIGLGERTGPAPVRRGNLFWRTIAALLAVPSVRYAYSNTDS